MNDNWLKEPPAEPPPEPAHVDLERLMAILTQAEMGRPLSPAEAVLRTQGPKLQLDKWGQPLPLSAVDQGRLDRLWAVMASPYDRCRALLRAGMLAPDEVQALSAAFPELYDVLKAEAEKEMITTEPPYQRWAETVLGTLFQAPAARVYADDQGQPQQPPAGKPKASGGKGGVLPVQSLATQADRRDQAVRSERS